jgi:hypothetical protein
VSALLPELGKLLSKSNFRSFGLLNGSKVLQVIRCQPSLGYKREKLLATKVTLKVIRCIFFGNK